MDLKVFKVKKEYQDEQSQKDTVFEKVLFKCCILLFAVLIITQILLVIPSLRNRLNLTDKSLGVPLQNDEYLYNQGQLTLKLIENDPDTAVEILVNGDPVSVFENVEMSVNVKDGDVIEIDGSKSLIGHIIRVENISLNINSKCKNAVARVESNMQRLVKVQVN